MKCTHFIAQFGVEIGNCYITQNGQYFVFVLNDQNITTVEEANAWLAQQYSSGTPVIVEYELKTEEIIPYTPAQQEARNKLKNLSTYQYVNHIDLIANEEANMTLKYKQDLEITRQGELEGVVRNTDYANSTTGGTVKVNSNYGVEINSGTINPTVRNYAQYQAITDDYYFISKGTLENVIAGKELVNTSYHDSSKQNITDNSLATTNKTVPTAINEVNSIAKGANQALSYGNYSTMITAFNALDDDVYNVGQNIYILTLEVPDLWISSIESTSSTYTYTTDEAFMTALETNGYVQVGYYRLSALETQKVDLTNYVENTDYGTQNTGGVVKVWTSYNEDNEIGLNISTE